MKKVLIWSIQHTGTFFCSYLMASSVPRENQLHFGSLYQRHLDMGSKRYFKSHPIDFSDFAPAEDGKITEKWFDKYITSLKRGPKPKQDRDLSTVNFDQIKILVAHDHHHKVGSELMHAVRQVKPEVPFIVPMRDPLLSLHSKMWRETEIYEKKDKDAKRVRRAELCVDGYTDLLSVPKGHLFYLPIDTESIKTEGGRVRLSQEAHRFAGIKFNDRARKFAVNWRIKNSTEKLVKGNGKQPDPEWEHLKKLYLDRDINPIKEKMSIEFDYLRKQDNLKKLMQKIGYKELPWW